MSKIFPQFEIINAEKTAQLQNVWYMHIPLRDTPPAFGTVCVEHVGLFLLVQNSWRSYNTEALLRFTHASLQTS